MAVGVAVCVCGGGGFGFGGMQMGESPLSTWMDISNILYGELLNSFSEFGDEKSTISLFIALVQPIVDAQHEAACSLFMETC